MVRGDLRAVGQPRRVAQKREPRARKLLDERSQHRQSAEAGIEDADGGSHGF